VDRRQVQHVESHRGHAGQAFRCRAERAARPRAVLAELRALAPGEELVPAAHARALALDAQRNRLALGDERGYRSRLHHLGELGVIEHTPDLGGREPRVDGGDGLLHDGALRGASEQAAGDLQHERNIDSGRDLDLGVVMPGRPLVGEGPHPPGPLAVERDRHVCAPAVRARGDRPHPVHALDSGGVGDEKLHAELVMALAKNGRLERHDLASEGLRGPQRLGLLRHQVSDRDATQLRFVVDSHHSTVLPRYLLPGKTGRGLPASCKRFTYP
jgi:hypothetical protein